MWQLARRDVLSRYRGSSLGLAWALVNPLILLAVFTFVFGTVFESRWGVSVDDHPTFALVLFAGLIVFWLFADCVNRAPGLLLENPSYVKRVVFPLEILPWVVLLSTLFHTGLNAGVLLAAHVLLLGAPPWTAAWAPVLLAPVALVILGVSWHLASLGVYLRDAKQIVPMWVLVVMFLSPIFYPASAVPEPFRALLVLNPLAWVLERTREALFVGIAPDPVELAVAIAGAWIVAWLGLAWFQRTRRGFADVL